LKLFVFTKYWISGTLFELEWRKPDKLVYVCAVKSKRHAYAMPPTHTSLKNSQKCQGANLEWQNENRYKAYCLEHKINNWSNKKKILWSVCESFNNHKLGLFILDVIWFSFIFWEILFESWMNHWNSTNQATYASIQSTTFIQKLAYRGLFVCLLVCGGLIEIQTPARILIKFCTLIPTCPRKVLVQFWARPTHPSEPWGPETLEAEEPIIENCLQNKRCLPVCKLTPAVPGTSASTFILVPPLVFSYVHPSLAWLRRSSWFIFNPRGWKITSIAGD